MFLIPPPPLLPLLYLVSLSLSFRLNAYLYQHETQSLMSLHSFQLCTVLNTRLQNMVLCI